jgi:hypothetical protein
MQPEQAHGHGLNAGREKAVNGAHGGVRRGQADVDEIASDVRTTFRSCIGLSWLVLHSLIYWIVRRINAHKIPPRQRSKAFYNHPLGNKTPFPNLTTPLAINWQSSSCSTRRKSHRRAHRPVLPGTVAHARMRGRCGRAARRNSTPRASAFQRKTKDINSRLLRRTGAGTCPRSPSLLPFPPTRMTRTIIALHSVRASSSSPPRPFLAVSFIVYLNYKLEIEPTPRPKKRTFCHLQ